MKTVPKIVINGANDFDTLSVSSNESDNPDQSKIFSKIEKVQLVKENQVRSEGAHLTKDEAERCIQELKNIVADFEKCTKDITVPNFKIEEKLEDSKLNLDLSGVNSDSDDTDSLVYEYEPLTGSLTDLRKANHEHRYLIRKGYREQHKSLENLSPRPHGPLKKYKSLDFAPDHSVKELRRTFEKKNDALCDHNRLKIFDPYETESKMTNQSPTRVTIGAGRVAALTKHFSSLGDAGVIKFRNAATRLNGMSNRVLNSLIYMKTDAETQTSVRSTPNLKIDAEVQFEEPMLETSKSEESLASLSNQNDYSYDYSLIYSLGKKKVGFSLGNLLGIPPESLEQDSKARKSNEPRKKFPQDYIRRRKPQERLLNVKWRSAEVLTPRGESRQSSDIVEGSKAKIVRKESFPHIR